MDPRLDGADGFPGRSRGAFVLMVGLVSCRNDPSPPPLPASEDHGNAASVEDLRALAESGDPAAQFSLSTLLAEDRPGAPADLEESARWMRSAAEQGMAVARASLGFLYLDGRGVPEDPAEGARWLRLAAEQGLAVAQAHLGWMCVQGFGVPQDPAEGARLLHLAAVQGLSTAQSNLGLLHLRGEGVAQDDVVAAQWISLAAEQGLAAAQEKLGTMHELGRGVAQDDVAAHMWYSLAAARGASEAGQRLEVLARRMLPDDILRARDRASAWTTRHEAETMPARTD